jgi:hypothetical protein
MPSSPKQIDYAPPATPHKKHMQRVVILVTLVVVLILGYRLSPVVWRNAQLWYWQVQCLGYEPVSPEAIIDQTSVPHAWLEFYALLSPPGQNSGGTLFLHQRIGADGRPWLVTVDLAPQSANSVIVRTFAPGSIFQPAKEIRDYNITWTFGGVKWTYGKTDPADPSHFTLRYTSDGQVQVVDGWLTTLGDVRLEIRPAPQTSPSTAP